MEAGPAILIIGVLGSVLVFFLAWRRPTVALAVWLMLFTVFSEYILLPNAATLHVHLSRALLTALCLGLAVGWVPRTTRLDTPVLPAVLLVILTAWTILTAFITGTIYRVDGTRNLSVFLTGFFVPGMVLYFARYFPPTLKVTRTIYGLLTALLLYMIATAFFEHFHINALVFPQYILDPSIGIHPERSRGPIVNAAENGGMLAVLLLVGLHTVLYTYDGAMRWILSAGLLGAGVLALFFTQTRGTWLAFIGGFGIMVLHKKCRTLVLGLGAVCVLGVVVYLIASATSVGTLASMNPLPKRSDNTEDTEDFRKNLYQESIRPFEDHPLIGWGLGTFTDEDYLFDGYGGSMTITEWVLHDTVIAITLESGSVGGLLYIAFLISSVVILLRLRKNSPTFEIKDVCVVGIASVAAFYINGLFVDIRYFAQQNALVFFLIGIGLGLPKLARTPVKKPALPALEGPKPIST